MSGCWQERGRCLFVRRRNRLSFLLILSGLGVPLFSLRVGAEEIQYKGYLQARFLANTGDQTGPSTEFLIRRARFTFRGETSEWLKFKFQVDAGEGDVKLIDGYIDLILPAALVGTEQKGVWRLRVGQSNVPVGLDTPRSSSRRLPLERVEILRRTNLGERDLGVYLMYTPKPYQDLFKRLKGNYGPGDYGFITVGFINGQGRNEAERDSNKPLVVRLDYPFAFSWGGRERLAQVGLSGRWGKFTTVADVDGDGNVDTFTVNDSAANFFLYLPPEPWGLEVDWVFAGEGPALNPAGNAIVAQDRTGFGVLGSYRVGQGVAFLRYDKMDGWRKAPNQVPSRRDWNRWSVGYVYEIEGRNRITVEYDFVDLNGRNEDQLGIQWQVVF
jgi:hypothetical protein